MADGAAVDFWTVTKGHEFVVKRIATGDVARPATTRYSCSCGVEWYTPRSPAQARDAWNEHRYDLWKEVVREAATRTGKP